MAARVQLQPAWLLSVRPYRESSLLLEAWTAEHGRVGLVARGARGPKARLRAILQPLQPLLLSWQQAGELATLMSAEAAGPALPLGGERVFYAWYINELVLRLLQRQDPHPELYPAYEQALARLSGPEGEFALRLFEKHLLAEIGYGLELDDQLDPEAYYRQDAEGQLRRDPHGPISGLSLIALRDERLPEADRARVLAELRRLLREQLRHQLGGRELETPKLLRQLREAGVSAPRAK